MNPFKAAGMTTLLTKELPQDIVTEIQLRLPVKSLVRFRCISKHWLSLITDPKFTRWHLNRLQDYQNRLYDCDNSTTNNSCPQSSVILSYYCTLITPVKYGRCTKQMQAESKIKRIEGDYREDTFEEAVDLDFPLSQGQSFNIKCCCDGLVCLVIQRTTLIVWNPSIGQHRRLPLPPDVDAEIVGFGYDSSIDDYKVVRLPSLTSQEVLPGVFSIQAHVFNLKSNYWRTFQQAPYIISEYDQTAIHAHGGIYWIARLYYRRKKLILRFDVADETFKEIALPPPCKTFSRYCRLGLWGGFICMMRGREFWVMKGDCEQSWTKVMTIPNIPAPLDSIFSSFFEPLCLTKSGKVVIVVARVKFFLYDPKEQTVRELHFCGLQEHGWFHETLYFESLVSPHGGNA